MTRSEKQNEKRKALEIKMNAGYAAAREIAQKKANEFGYNYGLHYSEPFNEWSSRMLPMKKNRYGHDVTCEVVWCENLDKCQVGHGPGA